LTKEYRIDNKDIIKDKAKEYNIANKDNIAIKKRAYKDSIVEREKVNSSVKRLVKN
jgi:hypothetical protein